MRRIKKHLSWSLALILVLSLALSSLVMAEGLSGGEQPAAEAAAEDVNAADNGCPEYSVSRDHITVAVLRQSIVDNGDGTATATFSTTRDCVQVSVSSYALPADWVGPGGEPYEDQIFHEGVTAIYPKAGQHTVRIGIPACVPYQADIYSGPEQRVLGTGGHGITIVDWLIKPQNTCAGDGDIRIYKYLDEVEGAPHAGIGFEIWKDGALVASGTTDADGYLEFLDLPVGTYELKELTLDGFLTDLTENKPITVTKDSSTLTVVVNTPKLKLEAVCSANPDEERTWKITNESNIEVPFTWIIEGTAQFGEGNVPANGSAEFTANTENTNTAVLSWSKAQQLSAASDGTVCATPTPTNTSTPTPTPTSTTTPTPTPTNTSTPTPTPTSTTTPTPTPTSTTTPTPTPDIDVDEEEVPGGGINDGEEDDQPPTDTVIEVPEETVPIDTLPKTGDSSPVPYYLIGAFTLSAGLLSLRSRQGRKKPQG
ncbi:SpaA isopeptide-forming pilin-related protein [Paenibacillus arenilitoris]|uniref:LPXTG cell wall anchor domain-containing protein n=1 Tax=Paenibacillus arenilitoris TaxID=2772299 RepID=A0A927CKS7_9BACL|nr:SpaA isopeptide-forming pilin-related protein [Paenibacillus arenilitoris]MBD2868403.1 LPXTG cell wall anchor domain-containing protein [Paenibacillus arenilitoris]